MEQIKEEKLEQHDKTKATCGVLVERSRKIMSNWLQWLKSPHHTGAGASQSPCRHEQNTQRHTQKTTTETQSAHIQPSVFFSHYFLFYEFMYFMCILLIKHAKSSMPLFISATQTFSFFFCLFFYYVPSGIIIITPIVFSLLFSLMFG